MSPGDMTLASARIRVNALQDSVRFYTDVVGLNQDGHDLLDPASGKTVLQITHDSAAHRPVRPRAGLFHLAFLYPSPEALAAAIGRVSDAGLAAHGFQDHGVSEAFYLSDPEGNGIELYHDRPESQWPRQGGQLAMGSIPIDTTSWLSANSGAPQSNEVRLGHVHLRASSLEASEGFYTQTLRMDVTQDSYPGARFLSYGSYHHHIALNVWSGEGLEPRQPNETGLESITLSGTSTESFTDPNNIEIAIAED